MNSLIPYRYSALTRPSRFFGDDWFRSFFGDLTGGAFRVDIREEADRFVLEAELPGLTREQIHVDVEEGVLTISCDAAEKNGDGYLMNERISGSTSRSFTIGRADTEHIEARYENGVLTLTLPKQQENARRGRSIDIR